MSLSLYSTKRVFFLPCKIIKMKSWTSQAGFFSLAFLLFDGNNLRTNIDADRCYRKVANRVTNRITWLSQKAALYCIRITIFEAYNINGSYWTGNNLIRFTISLILSITLYSDRPGSGRNSRPLWRSSEDNETEKVFPCQGYGEIWSGQKYAEGIHRNLWAKNLGQK